MKILLIISLTLFSLTALAGPKMLNPSRAILKWGNLSRPKQLGVINGVKIGRTHLKPGKIGPAVSIHGTLGYCKIEFETLSDANIIYNNLVAALRTGTSTFVVCYGLLDSERPYVTKIYDIGVK